MSSSSGTSVGSVSDLWRYPVKSFRGQHDRRAFLSPFGFLVRENMFGVYCRVVRAGWVQVGDRVTIGRVPARASA